MNQEALKNLGRRFWRRLRERPDLLKQRPRPFRDWHHLLRWWLIGLVIAAGFHFWLFRYFSQEALELAKSATQTESPKLDPKNLDEVVKYWQAREAAAL